MSESSVPGQPALAGSSPFAPGAAGYQLSDDLARLCLPQEFKDAARALAWVNSICALFLAIGLVGLKAPEVVQRPLSEVTEVVPVIFTPPEDQPKPEPEVKPDEPQPPDTPLDTPQVITVAAVVDSPAVAFSVPVQGAVAVASSPRFASPPPPGNYVAPRPTKFNPNATDGGSYPPPDYPSFALRNRYQGTVTIELTVDASGAVTSLKVQKTSGFTILDDAALKVVKNRWRFPPGGPRYYYWPCTFQIQ